MRSDCVHCRRVYEERWLDDPLHEGERGISDITVLVKGQFAGFTYVSLLLLCSLTAATCLTAVRSMYVTGGVDLMVRQSRDSNTALLAEVSERNQSVSDDTYTYDSRFSFAGFVPQPPVWC